MKRWQTWSCIGCVAVLGVFLVLSSARFASSRSAAHTAYDSLHDCRALTEQIALLKQAPAQATLERASLDDLTSWIEAAAQQAALPATSLQRIEPGAEQRVGRSDYVVQPTVIELRDVSLASMAVFLPRLTEGRAALVVTSLRLMSPRQPTNGAQETWNVELTLTQRIFSPQSGGRGRSPEVGI